MKLIHDDHVHLRPHCGIGRKQAAHSLDTYALAARDKSLLLGVREHTPLPDPYKIGPEKDYYTSMSESEVEPFLELFRNSEIAAGFEVDLLKGSEIAQGEILDNLLSRAAAKAIAVSGINVGLHFLPGSVKEVPDDKGNCPDVMWDMSEEIFVAHLKDRGLETLLKDYFECLHKAIDWVRGQVLSHIELIRKFDVILGHPFGRETLFKYLATISSIQLERLFDGVERLFTIFNDVTRHTRVDHFRN